MHLTLLLLLLLAVTIASAQEDNDDGVQQQSSLEQNDDCAGGTCPNRLLQEEAFLQEEECGMWLGPSPIKLAEVHGFGLGVFTGKNLAKGTKLESELLIPVYDTALDSWPPLREYVWDGSNMPEVAMQSRKETWLFMPGLAGIAACTGVNYNLELLGPGTLTTGRDNVQEDVSGAEDATEGSFSYRHSVTYTAVRDIVAGEELTVQCSDDDYDGGAYYLSKYQHDNAIVCVDDNVRVDRSQMVVGQQGLFAKRHLQQNQVILSTPLVPIHRKELEMENSQQQQLLLNYCFGHSRSDLLLLPYGPLVNYINHSSEPNVAIAWHSADTSHLPQRQQHHHVELLEMDAERVAEMHGKGLMMDLVALRDIRPNEELSLDYGADWQEAWKAHVNKYTPRRNYVSAATYMRDNDVNVIRTISEQVEEPYPDNVLTACFYDPDAPELDEEDLDDDDDDDDAVYTSWITELPHLCLRPCLVLDHYQDDDGVILYKAKMLPIDNQDVSELCELETSHVARDIPRHAIRILDRPYTSDVFLENAFRHEIGVPDGFFPDVWMQKKVRRRSQERGSHENGDSFKRKKRQ